MLYMPSLTSPRPQCSLQKLSNQISAATKEKEVIEAKETTVNFVHIREITIDFPTTVPNALIATNTVISKRGVSLSKTTKLVLVIKHKILVFRRGIPHKHYNSLTNSLTNSQFISIQY